MTTERQPLKVVGLTHASIVMPVVRSSEFASATVTQSLVPLNESAEPNLPPAFHVAPETVPVLLLPDASVTVVPLPSSKLYAATRPCACAGVLSSQTARPPTRARNDRRNINTPPRFTGTAFAMQGDGRWIRCGFLEFVTPSRSARPRGRRPRSP